MEIGLSSFKDHPFLHLDEKSTLHDYASNLHSIELDTVFYGIPKKSTVEKWQKEVPEDFKFFIKAYGGMTDHKHWQENYETMDAMYENFKESFGSLKEKNQLGAVLFQFSNAFVFTKDNGRKIMEIRHFLPDWPLAIEFRHGSWFTKENIKGTLSLLAKLQITLVAVDEAQLAQFPVPFFIYPTNPDFLYVRLHGRNKLGWLSGKREFRTFYDYSPDELQEITEKINKHKDKFKEIYVIFNNNAGFHAAKNALDFKGSNEENLTSEKLNPKQMDLFS